MTVLFYLNAGAFTEEIFKMASTDLGFTDGIPLNPFEL